MRYLLNEALPVLEIVPKSGMYDYKHKYTSGMSEYIVPANIPDDVAKKAQQQALTAFNSIGCEGYSRVDFRMNDKNELFCLEVNTLAGNDIHKSCPESSKSCWYFFRRVDQ